MSGKNTDKPATKADVNSLKADLDSLGSNLRSEMRDVKSELKAYSDDKFKNLSGENLKLNFKMDRIESRLNTELATKGDINRIFNLLDGIAGDIKSYQRKDTLRGDAVMRHEEQITAHETRITLLEEKK